MDCRPRLPRATHRSGNAEVMAEMVSSFRARSETHWRRNSIGKCHGFMLLMNTMLWPFPRDGTPVRVPEHVVPWFCSLTGDECSSSDQTSYVPITGRTMGMA